MSEKRKAAGSKKFEAQLTEKFKLYVPKLSPDHSLLPISAAYHSQRTIIDNAIESFEQSFIGVQRMLPTQFRHTIRGKTINGDSVEVTFWYDNLTYTPPHVVLPGMPALPPIPGLAILTGQTYACYVTADFHAYLTLTETSEERQSKLRQQIIAIQSQLDLTTLRQKPKQAIPKRAKTEDIEEAVIGGAKHALDPNVQVLTSTTNPNRLEVHQKNALKANFPIMVGSKWCSLVGLRKTPAEAWKLGEDPNEPGGYIILNGRPITCGSVYTHTPNVLMSMISKHGDLEIYSTIMTRRDPFFGNTYQLAPTITRQKLNLPKRQTLMQCDITIEIMWNQPGMNPKEIGSIKQHLSRVPIYALFCYYGCRNHTEMRNYIFPGIDDSDARVRLLIDAVTMGQYHTALHERAHPVTASSAILHVGECVLSNETKMQYRSDIAEDVRPIAKDMELSPEVQDKVVEMLYEERVSAKARDILDGTFFFNVNHDPRKVCLTIGSIVAKLINIKLGLEDPTDRSNLAFNRIQPIGEQFTGEMKKHIKKELLDPVVRRVNTRVFERYPWDAMRQAFPLEVTAAVAEAGSHLSVRVERGFKSSSKAKGQQPRLLEEVFDVKNRLFVMSKINETNIRPPTGGGGGSAIPFSRREVHPSQAFMVCPIQTPESGADVGRYQQPTIYAQLSTCVKETDIRELLQMRDRAHPASNARLESAAESAESEEEVVVS